MAPENIKNGVIALLLYAVLSVLLTYPLVFHMNDSVPGSYDVWDHLWNLWWVKKSLLELHSSPYYSDYVFHPTGADLGLHEMTLLNGLMALPFKDTVFAYNVLCLLSFILAGFGMYLLAKYIISDVKAAFVSGFIYAFAPYHFFELSLGHLNLLTIQWIPFYILYLIKTVREKEKKNFLYGVVFLLLVSLSTWQYALYTVLFTLLYIFHLYLNKRIELFLAWKRLTALALCYIMLVSPFLTAGVISLLSHERTSATSLGTLMYYSSDISSIFLPNMFHPLYGKEIYNLFATRVEDNISSIVLSIGLTVLLLILYYVVVGTTIVKWVKEKVCIQYTPKAKKILLLTLAVDVLIFYWIFGLNLQGLAISAVATVFLILLYYLIKHRRIGFWLLSAVVFWLLSLGPMLQFLGRYYFPLPYILLMFIPLIRAPYRAAVIFNLSAAVLAGRGIVELNKRLSKGKLLALLVFFLMLFEFLSVPVPLTKVSIPEFYHMLSRDSGNFSLLEIQTSPLSLKTDRGFAIHDMPQYMYYQTVHNKPIVGGFMSSVYQDLVDFLDNTPVLYELRHPGSQDILRHNLTEIADGMLTYYNVKYIIVHENTTHFQDFFQPNSSGKINQTLQDLFPDNEVVYSDSDIYVLKVDEVRTPLFMKLGRGWLLPSNNTRWMKKQAELVVVSPAAFETKICFEVMAFREGLMQVGTQTFDISNSFNNLSVDVTLSKGENVILFKSPDGCLQEEPCKSFNFKSISIGC